VGRQRTDGARRLFVLGLIGNTLTAGWRDAAARVSYLQWWADRYYRPVSEIADVDPDPMDQ
jgi:hypothetical protein